MADRFHDLVAAYGYSNQEELLRRYVLPCIGFSLHPGPNDAVGRSRLGGGPDLPLAFGWPENKGRPLDFLLQVNLADSATFDGSGRFPQFGLLSFFYDLEEQPYGSDPKNLRGFAVRYFSDLTSLRRYPPPHPKTALKEATLSFRAAETFPSFGSQASDRLQDELLEADVLYPEESDPGVERSRRSKGRGIWASIMDFHPFASKEARNEDEFGTDALNKLASDLFNAYSPTPSGPLHQLGGHPADTLGDMQLEAQLVTNGIFCGDASGYQNLRASELEQTCEEWSLLLQLDSDKAGHLKWGDPGRLYYWIRSTDLAHRDFSNVWMTLQDY